MKLLNRLFGSNKGTAGEGRVDGVMTAMPEVRALKSRDSNARQAAAKSLGEKGPAAVQAVPVLIEALDDPVDAVRGQAAWALGKVGPAARDAVPALIRLAKRETGVGRFFVFKALGDIGVAAMEAVPVLLEAMKEGGPLSFLVRQHAGEAIAKITQTAPNRLDAQSPTVNAEDSLNDSEMVQLLQQLCRAYAANDRAMIVSLEPKATDIGKVLDRRGGIAEMRRIFDLIPVQQGRRTLEMHWGGIGEWRG